MRIVDIVTTVVGAPWRELTFVELVADDGRRGLGEVRMVTKTDTLLACISELGERHVVGADPFDRETLAFNIQRAEYGRPGEVTQSAPAPFDSPSGLARVRGATRRPIATGERLHLLADFRAIIEQGLVDIVQADLTHFGGFTGLRRLAAWAEAYELPLAPHNVCGPVGTAANIHFAVATPNHLVLEHFNDFADTWVSELRDAAPGVDARDGCFPVPTGAGLGFRRDHDACAEHPRTHAGILLFSPGREQ